jgi:4-amino-4-deoxy-L-arabinose transferase-like glycosyltransferase
MAFSSAKICDRDQDRASADRSKTWIFAAAVILFGSALRLYHINGQSLWYDELFSIQGSRLGWDGMMKFVINDAVHPPLHYVLMHWVFGIFGVGEPQSRLPSVLFGAGELFVVWLLARKLFNSSVATIATAILAVSQIAITHSQEARGYEMTSFLAAVAAYAFVSALTQKRMGWWWGFVATAVLLLYTHYYSIFVLAGFVWFGIAYRRRFAISGWWWIALGAVVGVAYSPWLLSGIVRNILNAGRIRGGVPHLLNSMTVLNGFNNGKWNGLSNGSPWWTYLLGDLLFCLPAGYGLWRAAQEPAIHEEEKWQEEKWRIRYLLLLWLLPSAGILFVSVALRLQFDIRYTAFGLAPYYILVACGIDALPRPWRVLNLAALMIYSLGALRANYFIPANYDFRSAVNYAGSAYRTGDCMAVLPATNLFAPAEEALYVYQGQTKSFQFATIPWIMGNRDKCKAAIVVWDHTWWRDHQVIAGREMTLFDAKYSPSVTRNFSPLEIRIYAPVPAVLSAPPQSKP